MTGVQTCALPISPANFEPKVPFALYLFGTAGAGKSSFVRVFRLALAATLDEFVDPELQIRLIKQNLNKTYEDLDDELTLRPNNNDLSTMSVIQGRRQTLAQTKPGLVCIHFEEVPPNDPSREIYQAEILGLLAYRFKGIAKDYSLLSFFTSNYPLDAEVEIQLHQLAMFSQLQMIEWHAISGDDRLSFVKEYVARKVHEDLQRRNVQGVSCVVSEVRLDMGDGDIRPLVRHARTVAFWIAQRLLEAQAEGGSGEFTFSATHNPMTSNVDIHIHDEGHTELYLSLRYGQYRNLFPVDNRLVDPRSSLIYERILARTSRRDVDELLLLLDSYLADALAPAVLVSHDSALIRAVVEELAREAGVTGIHGIDATNYKLARSLYDAHDTRNLRDDIRTALKHTTMVAVEVIASSTEAQMMIRELIEDTPSMIAFSTDRSALHKDGLFFGVTLGSELSPEIESRATLFL